MGVDLCSQDLQQTDQALATLAAGRAAQPLPPLRVPSRLISDLAARADQELRDELQPPWPVHEPAHP